jgi:hypothetical protein
MEFQSTLRLALPLIFAEISWMRMDAVDTIMVGRFLTAQWQSDPQVSGRVSTPPWRSSVADYCWVWILSWRKPMDVTIFRMPGACL